MVAWYIPWWGLGTSQAPSAADKCRPSGLGAPCMNCVHVSSGRLRRLTFDASTRQDAVVGAPALASLTRPAGSVRIYPPRVACTRARCAPARPPHTLLHMTHLLRSRRSPPFHSWHRRLKAQFRALSAHFGADFANVPRCTFGGSCARTASRKDSTSLHASTSGLQVVLSYSGGASLRRSLSRIGIRRSEAPRPKSDGVAQHLAGTGSFLAKLGSIICATR